MADEKDTYVIDELGHTQHPTGRFGGPPLTYSQASEAIKREYGGEGEPPEHTVVDLVRSSYRGTPPSTEEILRDKMAEETGRFAGVEFQETEDTGRPRSATMDERKRVGAEVTRLARDMGVGGTFTAPEGLDQEGLNKWQDAAMADLRKKSMSPEEILRDMTKAEQKSYGG
jgi:hypothetical protein